MAAISPAMPNVADEGNSAMPARRQHEPGENDRQPAPAAGARPVRHRTGPGDKREQQHVVDGHDAADGRAMLSERVAHQDRHEVTEERSGYAKEETAQANLQAGDVRRPVRTRRIHAGVTTIHLGALPRRSLTRCGVQSSVPLSCARSSVG